MSAKMLRVHFPSSVSPEIFFSLATSVHNLSTVPRMLWCTATRAARAVGLRERK